MSIPRPPAAEKEAKAASKPLCLLALDCVIRECVEFEAGATTTDVLLRLRLHHNHWHEHGTVSKRLSELAAGGLIYSLGDLRLSPLTKKPQTIWRPSFAGIAAHSRWRTELAARRAA